MIVDKIKKKLLTKWFIQWVKTEEDYETLDITKQMIEQRQDILEPPLPTVVGFRASTQKDNESY